MRLLYWVRVQYALYALIGVFLLSLGARAIEQATFERGGSYVSVTPRAVPHFPQPVARDRWRHDLSDGD